MMPDFQFLDILLLAMVAAFIVLRLRRVLGRRTGHEQRPQPLARGQGSESSSDDNIIHLPDANSADAVVVAREADESPVLRGLAAIRAADESFDPKAFLDGAKAAYEMIVKAFADGDEDTLGRLLSDEVYGRFKRVIDDRRAKGHTHETTIVGIKAAEILEAGLTGRIAEVTVRFESQLINVTRNDTGAVVDGDPTAIEDNVDIWTFTRDVRSRDPNWTLVATRVPH